MFRLTVDQALVIRGRGLVATGKVELGSITVGDELRVNGDRAIRVDGIEAFRKLLTTAAEGDNIGLLFTSLGKNDLNHGDVLTSEDGGATFPTGGDDLGARAAEIGLG